MDSRKLNWKIILIMTAAYIATNINLQGFMALLPFVREELSLSRVQIGLYSTFFFAGATLLGILTGRYADLFGAKKGIILGVSCVGVLMLFHSLAGVYLLLLLLAFLSGIAFSFVAPSVNKGIILWISPEKRALSLGLAQTGVGIGGFLGAALLPILAKRFGWRLAVLFPGSFVFILAFIIFEMIPDKGYELVSKNKLKTNLNFKNIISDLLKNSRLINLFFIGFIFAGINSFAITHFTVFLHNDIGFSKTIAGFGLGVLQIGGLIALPGWGWFNDKYLAGHRVKGLLILGYTIAFIVFLVGFLFYSFKLPFIITFIIIFFLGLSALGWLGFYMIFVSETVEKEKTGTAVALALVFVRFGMLISPPAFGYFSDLFFSYRLSWFLLSCIAFISTIIFHLRERKNI